MSANAVASGLGTGGTGGTGGRQGRDDEHRKRSPEKADPGALAPMTDKGKKRRIEADDVGQEAPAAGLINQGAPEHPAAAAAEVANMAVIVDGDGPRNAGADAAPLRVALGLVEEARRAARPWLADRGNPQEDVARRPTMSAPEQIHLAGGVDRPLRINDVVVLTLAQHIGRLPQGVLFLEQHVMSRNNPGPLQDDVGGDTLPLRTTAPGVWPLAEPLSADAAVERWRHIVAEQVDRAYAGIEALEVMLRGFETQFGGDLVLVAAEDSAHHVIAYATQQRINMIPFMDARIAGPLQEQLSAVQGSLTRALGSRTTIWIEYQSGRDGVPGEIISIRHRSGDSTVAPDQASRAPRLGVPVDILDMWVMVVRGRGDVPPEHWLPYEEDSDGFIDRDPRLYWGDANYAGNINEQRIMDLEQSFMAQFRSVLAIRDSLIESGDREDRVQAERDQLSRALAESRAESERARPAIERGLHFERATARRLAGDAHLAHMIANGADGQSVAATWTDITRQAEARERAERLNHGPPSL